MKHTRLFSLIIVLLFTGFLFACEPIEPASDEMGEPVEDRIYDSPEGVQMARDAVLAYLEMSQHIKGLMALSDWTTKFITQPNIVGQGAYQFNSGAWMVAVSYPIVAPENVIYTVQVTNPMQTYMWSGTVTPAGLVSEITDLGDSEEMGSDASRVVVGWFGYIERLPAGGQWDDKLVLSNDAGEIGIEGKTEDVQIQIEELRDKEEPGKYAHFWGELICDVPDVGACQLRVSRIRVGATYTDPEPVEGWVGTLFSNSEEMQFDDCFELAGEFPVAFGIHSLDPMVQADIESLRDTGQAFKVWGILRTGVPDSFGSQIEVDRIEGMH